MHKCLYILMLLTSVLASAETQHWLGFSLGGGLSMLPSQSAGDVRAKAGGVGNLEALYELQAGHFLFHTGLGVGYSVNKNASDIARFGADITEYTSLQYQYATNSFSETNKLLQGYIPLMVGARFSRFYFLLGAKLNVLHSSQYTDKAEVEIFGKDEDVVGEMHGLYTHSMGFKNYESDRQKYSMTKVPIMGSAEVGMSLRQTERHDIRLALFVDYAINPDMKVSSNETGAYQMTAIDQLSPQSIFGNIADGTSLVRQMQVGAKLTFLFSLPKTRRMSGPCHCEDF